MNTAITEEAEIEKINGVIYKVTNKINGKIYIGLTIRSLDVRMNQHLYDSKSLTSDNYFYRAIKKYGSDNFVWETIDKSECIEELSNKEEYWISYYNSFGDGGYNLTSGGNSGYRVSEESKIKQGKARENWWKENRHTKKQPKGSDIHSATLTEKDVLKIKDLILENELTRIEIAEFFNVSSTAINGIATGKTWKHLISEEDRKKIKELSGRLKESEIVEIKDLLIEGKLTQREIALVTGVGETTISGIKKGRNWASLITDEELKKMEESGVKRINEDDVLEIKKLLIETTISQNDIAKKFNIQISTISLIKSGKKWAYLSTSDELKLMNERKVDIKKRPAKLKSKNRKIKKHLSVKDVVMIKNLLIEGTLKQKEIASIFDVHIKLISLINTGKKWEDVFVPMWKEHLEDSKIRKGNKKTRQFAGFYVF